MKDRGTEYLLVYLALAALLGLTVAVAFLDLGAWNTVLSVGFAGAKALLVAAFYMHLKEGGGMVRLFAKAAFLWLALLVVLTLADYVTRPVLSPFAM